MNTNTKDATTTTDTCKPPIWLAILETLAPTVVLAYLLFELAPDRLNALMGSIFAGGLIADMPDNAETFGWKHPALNRDFILTWWRLGYGLVFPVTFLGLKAIPSHAAADTAVLIILALNVGMCLARLALRRRLKTSS
jgi:hypothetical protein